MNGIETGRLYKFGGYEWLCAESHDAYAVLQSTGVTAGYWPGYAMTGTITNASGSTITLPSEGYCYDDIDGYDISGYNETMQNLYSNIKAAEYTSASYGKGLYLASNSKAGTTSAGSQGSGYYWEALKTAADNYSSFGASHNLAWLGTVCSSDSGAWYVYSSGCVGGNNFQNNSYVVAPAFNLDLSKIKIDGNTIKINQATKSWLPRYGQ